jgi:hypothetical protein
MDSAKNTLTRRQGLLLACAVASLPAAATAVLTTPVLAGPADEIERAIADYQRALERQ